MFVNLPPVLAKTGHECMHGGEQRSEPEFQTISKAALHCGRSLNFSLSFLQIRLDTDQLCLSSHTISVSAS